MLYPERLSREGNGKNNRRVCVAFRANQAHEQCGYGILVKPRLFGILGYGDYRNFEGVIEKAKIACFNSGHRLEDHFVDVTEMIETGKAEVAKLRG